MSDKPPPEDVILPRHSKGERPSFFPDPAMDQMMTFILELATELWVVRERVDTIERLLDEKGSITRADIEDYRPDETVSDERIAARDAFLARILRMHPAD